VLIKDGVLTVYNTSKTSQEIINYGDLITFVAMALDISPEKISDMQEVEEESIELEFEDDD